MISGDITSITAGKFVLLRKFLSTGSVSSNILYVVSNLAKYAPNQILPDAKAR